jgi:hypothetical protein
MLLQDIFTLLETCNTDSSHLPPTVFYNEGWLLRLALNWFASNSLNTHRLNFMESANWFSGALLPSAFLPASRTLKDSPGESWTHADGVIGHFTIGRIGNGNLSLSTDASQLIVTEAKMYSKLSAGVRNAKYFDQAARNIACITELLRKAERSPENVTSLAFYVIAPESRIAEGVFSKDINRESIEKKVRRRAAECGGDKDQWLNDYFDTIIRAIEIDCISWESIIKVIEDNDLSYGRQVRNFYDFCILYNGRK